MEYTDKSYTLSVPPDFKGYTVEKAVPGYWEDMEDIFRELPFGNKLVINPEYKPLEYPMIGTAPDNRLPNILGNFFYRKTFDCDCLNENSVIHFDGVQNTVSVWINGVFLGKHEGYSSPFDMKIPEDVLKNGENTVVMSVSNYALKGYDDHFVSGLAARALTQCTGGITGDVELRVYTCPLRDATVLVSEDCNKISVNIDSVAKCNFEWQVCDGNKILKNGSADSNFEFDTEFLEKWSPENPKLYTLRIFCGASSLDRIFGVRRLTVDGVKLKLNGNPYYLRGVCEHYSYPYTIHSNHDKEFYIKMIKSFKELGFNFVRFHTCIPEEELMQVADELGILFHVECPGNTPFEQWEDIVKFCRRHPCVVIYCCGNELMLDAPFIKYLSKFADVVHEYTDALFSPMSALRGIEYGREESQLYPGMIERPFKHNPERLELLEKYADVYSSYANGFLSYNSLDADAEMLDSWSVVYNKPRLSHEICIDGTYADLSLIERYKGTRFEKTDMLTSIKRHMESKGVLEKVPLYFKNSCEWQRRIRKYCFEATRMCDTIVGYDFLGPIDTHWHTFGYDVGMMNEFYELKPGETVENVLRYNAETVLLTDLGKKVNFSSDELLSCSIFASHYGREKLYNPKLNIKLVVGDKTIEDRTVTIKEISNGVVSKINDFSVTLPGVNKPEKMQLCVKLYTDVLVCENEWELYVFPQLQQSSDGVVVSEGMSADELKKMLDDGNDVIIFGTEPFQSLPTSFRIALAGRIAGNLATVINKHAIVNDLPNDGFCGWQFSGLLECGNAVCFECDDVPFDPIIEVVSTHKNVIRQSILFEFKALNGRLLVCGFNFNDDDPAAKWLRAKIISYVKSDEFLPKYRIDEKQIFSLVNCKVAIGEGNKNFAFNENDKATLR